MSVHLFNFCVYHNYLDQLEASGKTLPEYVAGLGLDGIEHFIFHRSELAALIQDYSIGAHLSYWPYWMGLWQSDAMRLAREFGSQEEKRKYFFGAENPAEWLSVIRENIAAAAAIKPEYMVWHVAEADLPEAHTFHFQYSDREVLEAAAEVFNAVSDSVPEDITVLFENLWWPGLRLTAPEEVRFFFDRIQRKNVGIMLDTGHLMNTNPDLRSEAEAADYICRTVERLGEQAALIKGVHLSCSLSGEYQKTFPKIFHPGTTFWDSYKHISAIDQHRPFQTKAARRILEYVQPRYVNHEMIYSTIGEMKEKLTIQLANCF